MASPLEAASPAGTGVDMDKVYGTIYGQCTGDAIGLLTEFMDKRKALKYYQPPLEYHMKVSDRHRDSWRTGDWTDDSDQMILIMQALTHTGDKVSEDTLRTFSGDLYKWMLDGFRELGDRGGCGLGRTTHTVLTHPEFFDNPQKAAHEVWEGTGQAAAPNGAVMRTSILGVHHFWDLDTVGENANLFCQTTHADPRCVASCVAVTTAIAQMLQGETDLEKIIKKSFRCASAYLNHDKQVDELRWYMEPRQLEELQLDAHGVIGYTYKTLGAGFWALRQDNFRKAIERITMEAGDADTNAAVAGALLGCRLGRKSLPESWVMKMPHKKWLDWQISKYLQAVGLMGANRRPRGRDGEDGTAAGHHSHHGHTGEGHRYTGQPVSVSPGDTTQGKHREETSKTSQERHKERVRSAHRDSEQTRRSHGHGGLADSVSIRLPPIEDHLHGGSPSRSDYAGQPHHQYPQKPGENPRRSGHVESRYDPYLDKAGHAEPFHNQKPHDVSHGGGTGDHDHYTTSYGAAYGGQARASISHDVPSRGKQGSVEGGAKTQANTQEGPMNF